MRFRRLSLLRYGHLSDVVLEFPPEAGLCVVHGANEAGKSTTLAAIGDALFGFGHRSAFDFLHGGPQLRIGFTLTSRDGTEASFTRRKGRGQTLRDDADQPIPDAALQGFLGGASRELFEHMFGLDGDRLRDGGATLAHGGGVGESLFAAGTGLLGLRATLGRLDEEAKALVGDGRGKRRLSEAIDAWRQSQSEAERLSVLPRTWQEAEAERADARAQLGRVQEETARLRAEVNRLQRVRRVAPRLSELDAARAALREVADAPDLPADAEATVQRVRAARDEAGREAERNSADAARLTGDRDLLVRSPDLLEVQDAIDRLAEQRPIVAQAETDLPKVRAEAAGLRAAVVDAIADLGSGFTPEAALEALPAAEAIRTVRKLISDFASLTSKAAAALDNRKAAATKLDEADAAMRAQPAPADPALLRATIDRVRAEGRLDADLARAEIKLAAAQGKLATAVAGLPLWQGDPEALAAVSMPLPAERAAATARLETASAAIASVRVRLQTIRDETADLEDKLAGLGRGETVPTPEAIRASRAKRDRLWRRLRRMLEGGAVPAEADLVDQPALQPQDEFETLQNEVDRLTDRRADEAQRVADYLSVTARLDLLRERRAQAQADHAEAERAEAAAGSIWRDLWAHTGVAPAPPSAMTEWERGRDTVLELAEVAAEASRHRDELAARRDGARGALPKDAAAPDESLAAMLTRAEISCARAEAELTLYRELEATARRERANVPKLDGALRESEQALAAWRETWAAAVVPLGLHRDCGVDSAEAALDAWGRVAKAAPAWRAEERRIQQMAVSIERFEEQVRAVRISTEPATIVAARLIRGLSEARQAEEKADDLTRRITAHAEAAARALNAAREAETELGVLRRLAGAENDSGLDAAIGRARRRDAAVEAIARISAALASQGDGLTEAALREEAGCDPDAAAARLAAIETEAGELEAQRETLTASRTRAEASLEAMRHGQDAADASQQGRHALAEAATIAERYARLHVARVLLRSGIDHFRRAQQEPLLQAAGRHFASLTAGRYVRLGVDQGDDGKPLLAAVQDDGMECPAAALSEGARDQLYLALRIAAVEAHAASAEPLPFIADDLLVHFDDPRSAAAIALLARLGRTTQVILFTHHDHVAAMAAASHRAAGVAVLCLPDLLEARVPEPDAMVMS